MPNDRPHEGPLWAGLNNLFKISRPINEGQSILNTQPLLAHLRAWWPARMPITRRDWALSLIGFVIGLLGTEMLSRAVLGDAAPWLIAPMAASAVLLFLVPTGPMSQPWPLLGGNLLAVLIGVSCRHAFGGEHLVATAAAAATLAVMHRLRCLHPPSAAVALTAVSGPDAVTALGYHFLWQPVLVNSLFLLALAYLFNNLCGRRYPHQPMPVTSGHDTRDLPPSRRTGLAAADLDAALASIGTLVDIERSELEEILIRAQLNARQRHWRDGCCADIMARDVVCARADEAPATVWQRLRHHRVRALPVVDAAQRLVGIVSTDDFWIDPQQHAEHPPALRHAAEISTLMTHKVRTVRPEQPLTDLVELFSDCGLHQIPVVDGERRVLGVIVQSDLVAALFARTDAV